MRKFFEIHGIFASLAFVAFLLTPNSAKAEQSGWFMGVQAGYGKGERHRELEATKTSYTNVQHITYYFADQNGNINTIQKEERKPEITGHWNLGAASGGGGGISYIGDTYNIIQTYTFNPADQSTWHTTYKDNIVNFLTDKWTNGDAQTLYMQSIELNDELKGLNAGLLAGYKHFFSAKLGLRVYGLLDYSYYKDNDTALQKMQAYNANLNLDLLYNLYDKNERIMGVFAGLSVGGAQYISSKTRLASDIDIGLNFGLRFGAGKHSIELFSRVGGLFVGAEKYSTSDTAYSSSAMRLNDTQASYVNYNSVSQGNALQYILVCPASAVGCSGIGYEQGTGTNAASRAQYRYRVWRYQNTEYYTKEIIDSTAGSGVIERYKQPYKIGIRYIYSF